MRNRIRHLRRNERGMTMAFVAMGFMAFLRRRRWPSMSACTCPRDRRHRMPPTPGHWPGRLRSASTISTIARRPAAVSAAISAAQANTMIGEAPSVLPDDVTFPNDPAGDPRWVKVSVFRNIERYNEIPTIFGMMFGVDSVKLPRRRRRRPRRPTRSTAQAIHDSRSMDGGVPSIRSAVRARSGCSTTKGIPFRRDGDVYVPADQTGYTG